MRSILCLILLLLLVVPASAQEPAQSKSLSQALVISVRGRDCHHGLHHQPNGPFAVIVFCEDAAGTFVALVCYDANGCEKGVLPDGTTRFEGWENDNRVWQENPWTSDVDSIAWSPDGKSLFIATSEIYGSGGLYQLDLEARKFSQLLPANKKVSLDATGPGYTIVSVSKDGRELRYHVQESDKILRLSVRPPEQSKATQR